MKILAIILLVLSFPIWIVVWVAIKLDDGGSIIFRQKRAGKNRKVFVMYKFRTMKVGAEKLKKSLMHLNEADGPVFKIKNDPRFTKVGNWLSKTGLDELPQLVNVIRGEMLIVGPRPLPVDEARRVPKKYWERFSIAPGITSPWVVKGNHKLSFKRWMALDLKYVKDKSFFEDVTVIIKTLILITKSALEIIVE